MPVKGPIPHSLSAKKTHTAVTSSTASGLSKATYLRRSPAVSPPPQVKASLKPACERCVNLREASFTAIDAYTAMLQSVKSQFIQDIVNHVNEDDRWIHALRSLGVPEEQYFGRLAACRLK